MERFGPKRKDAEIGKEKIAQALFWSSGISTGTGGADRRASGWQGCAGCDAHRSWKIGMLPDSCIDAAWYNGCGIPADLSYEGSGRGNDTGRDSRCLHQFDPHRRRIPVRI